MLGHWETSPGLSLVYVHLTRAIVRVISTPWQNGTDESRLFHLRPELMPWFSAESATLQGR